MNATMEQTIKLAKAQASAEKAVEMAEMKRLYAAFVEGGMEINEACEMLRSRGSKAKTSCDRNEDQEKVDKKMEIVMLRISRDTPGFFLRAND